MRDTSRPTPRFEPRADMLLPVRWPQAFREWLALVFRVRDRHPAGRLAGVISPGRPSSMQG